MSVSPEKCDTLIERALKNLGYDGYWFESPKNKEIAIQFALGDIGFDEEEVPEQKRSKLMEIALILSSGIKHEELELTSEELKILKPQLAELLVFLNKRGVERKK